MGKTTFHDKKYGDYKILKPRWKASCRAFYQTKAAN
uniref:Uncharacterized protein n=1 Tax=Rhizophora mucronata TaxID=61149 RepID=A0A2P2MX56_RHIMU